jgi:hypothetical protein
MLPQLLKQVATNVPRQLLSIFPGAALSLFSIDEGSEINSNEPRTTVIKTAEASRPGWRNHRRVATR